MAPVMPLPELPVPKPPPIDEPPPKPWLNPMPGADWRLGWEALDFFDFFVAGSLVLPPGYAAADSSAAVLPPPGVLCAVAVLANPSASAAGKTISVLRNMAFAPSTKMRKDVRERVNGEPPKNTYTAD